MNNQNNPAKERMPHNAYGSIDMSDKGRKKFVQRCKDNLLKWKGMQYFPQYKVWAVNLTNAIRKANKNG